MVKSVLGIAPDPEMPVLVRLVCELYLLVYRNDTRQAKLLLVPVPVISITQAMWLGTPGGGSQDAGQSTVGLLTCAWALLGPLCGRRGLPD